MDNELIQILKEQAATLASQLTSQQRQIAAQSEQIAHLTRLLEKK